MTAVEIIDGLNYLRDVLEHQNQTVGSLYNRYASIPQGKVCIWVWEGKGGNKRRRNLYPDYKGKRPVASENIFKSVEMFQQLLLYTDCFQVKVDGYEGDDVIAQLVDMYADKYGVFIYSTDKDFRQLIRGPETGPGSVRTFSTPDADGVPDKYIRLAKTYIGDKSDNITGVPGLGPVQFFDMEFQWDVLMQKHENKDLADIEHKWGGMKPKPYTWAVTHKEEVQTFWNITGFYRPGVDVVGRKLTKGIYSPESAKPLLNQFFM